MEATIATRSAPTADAPDGVRSSTHARRRARGAPLLAVLAALLAATVLAGCFVLVQNQTFAIGTESNRANLVLHTGTSYPLDRYIIHGRGGSVQDARNAVLAGTPSKFQLPTAVRVLACSLGVAGCVAQYVLPGMVMSWWRSDVRNRGDFHEAMHEAADRQRCFAWTFVAWSGRNFTTKPVGTSGCRRTGA